MRTPIFFAQSYPAAAAWSGLSVEEVRRQVEAGTALIVVISGTPCIDTRTLRVAR